MNVKSPPASGSLRGRVWLAAIALAVINCICGLGVYLVLNFLTAEPLLTVATTFFVLALVTLGFGWWLASELLKPVEAVTLLARSLERSPLASLPRTTGAIETDQLLQSLHRSGQQLRNLTALMDDVAAGKVEAAMMPLESSDKLSASFQKLVAKVTDSISAKRDLDELQAAVSVLSRQVSGVRNGELDLSVRPDQPHLREIADAIRFLSTRLSGVTKQIYATGSECERTASETRATLQSALEAIDQRSAAISHNQPANTGSGKLESVLEELARSIQQASAAYDEHSSETFASVRLEKIAGDLAAGINEIYKLVQKLRERSAVVTQAARSARDLAKRSNLIALNAAIAAQGGTSNHEMIAAEIEELSRRSDEIQRQIASAGETLNSEIAGIEKQLIPVTQLSPEIGKALTANVRIIHTLCDHVAQFAELEEQIRAASEEEGLEYDRLRGILEKVSDVSLIAAMVRETEAGVQRFAGLMDGLRDSVSDLRISASTPIPDGKTPVTERVSERSHATPASNGDPPGSDAVSGFEAVTGFEKRTGFETVLDINAILEG